MRKALRRMYEECYRPMMRLVLPRKRSALIDGLYSGTAYKMTK